MYRWLINFLAFLFLLAGLGVAAALGVFYYFGANLPDSYQLAHHEMPVSTKIYAHDKQLVKTYTIEDRFYVPLHLIPEIVLQAFISAEDKNFYDHFGIDVFGMGRAALRNLTSSSKRPQGASTITQQVARNFFLTDEVSIARKIREAILAFRIEQALSKNEILELYLNKIYFGLGAYGIAKAAWNYFGKKLEKLSIHEIAYLAALPKAPSNYHPVRHKKAAIIRRNYVIDRMVEGGYISFATGQKEKEQDLIFTPPERKNYQQADFYTEEVRRFLIQKYGTKGLYGGGLSVTTPLNMTLQHYADHALRQGLLAYDRRHGWRGAISHLSSVKDWQQQLEKIDNPKGLGDWQLAVILSISQKEYKIGCKNGQEGFIPQDLRWGHSKIGDVIAVEQVTKNKKGQNYTRPTYKTCQIPLVNGGMIVMDPYTGRVFAVSGGFSYEQSEFNRATQAMRQIGSIFKPFIFLTALDNGYSPNMTILDAPLSLYIGEGLPLYTPKNYNNKYLGRVTLRTALEKSLNTAVVRLADKVGIDKVAHYGEKLGIADTMPRRFSITLGAQETTVLRLARAFSMVVNGGKKIEHSFIDSILNRYGEQIYKSDKRICHKCQFSQWENQPIPELMDVSEQILNPLTCFQLVSLMQGVVERGTARRLKDLNRPLGGKTGTSTDFRDAWFAGFSPDLVCVVYVGFDNHRSLGNAETGSRAALPIFKEFMKLALKDTPITSFKVPSGIRLVPTDLTTGQASDFEDQTAFYEAYQPGTEPNQEGYQVMDVSSSQIIDGLPWLKEEEKKELASAEKEIPEQSFSSASSFYTENNDPYPLPSEAMGPQNSIFEGQESYNIPSEKSFTPKNENEKNEIDDIY